MHAVAAFATVLATVSKHHVAGIVGIIVGALLVIVGGIRVAMRAMRDRRADRWPRDRGGLDPRLRQGLLSRVALGSQVEFAFRLSRHRSTFFAAIT